MKVASTVNKKAFHPSNSWHRTQTMSLIFFLQEKKLKKFYMVKRQPWQHRKSFIQTKKDIPVTIETIFSKGAIENYATSLKIDLHAEWL